jgi:hypothetical protein
MPTTPATTLFDLSGLEHRPGRYGKPVLRCPGCQKWCAELWIDGSGAFKCWTCRRAARTNGGAA